MKSLLKKMRLIFMCNCKIIIASKHKSPSFYKSFYKSFISLFEEKYLCVCAIKPRTMHYSLIILMSKIFLRYVSNYNTAPTPVIECNEKVI